MSALHTPLFWISWEQPTEDFRPLGYPPREPILGWWRTGDTQAGATLCALVMADDEQSAKALILAEWPEAERWRFCDRRESADLSDRFPLSAWMEPRFAKATGSAS